MTVKESNGMRRRRGRKENTSSTSKLAKEIVHSPVSSSSAVWRKLTLAIILVALVGILLFALLWRGDGVVTINKTTREESSTRNPEKHIKHDHYAVLEILPHDESAFTQGLTFLNGNLYEGTGLYGDSQLRHVDPQSGNVLSSHQMDRAYFGEGVAHFIDATGEMRLIQLTWKEKKGFIYSVNDFQVVQEFTYETTNGEGWGITYDEASREFVVSDGSSWLVFWDRDSLQERRRIQVKLKRQDSQGQHQFQVVSDLNELEWNNGTILANVWYQDVLIRIDPTTGFVIQVYDFSHLYKDRTPKADCFNGIALTDTPGELFVTGKWWPHMYRVKLLF